MSDDTANTSSQGSAPRSRWIQLTILSIIALSLWSLIGGWVYTEHAISQARACQPTCLDRQQATVEKTATYTTDTSGMGIYGNTTTSYRAWLNINGASQKVDNQRAQVQKGASVTVELLDGRVVTVQGHQVWNGWPISKTAGLVFLFPVALLATLGALTQVLALTLHKLRIRRATDLSTFGSALVGALTGAAVVIVGYMLMDRLPWYWVYVGTAGGLVVTAFCVSLVVNDAPRPVKE